MHTQDKEDASAEGESEMLAFEPGAVAPIVTFGV
jgi:hypothetical protein